MRLQLKIEFVDAEERGVVVNRACASTKVMPKVMPKGHLVKHFTHTRGAKQCPLHSYTWCETMRNSVFIL